MTLKKRATAGATAMTQVTIPQGHEESGRNMADLFYRFIDGIATWLLYPDVDQNEEFEDDAYVQSLFAMEESK